MNLFLFYCQLMRGDEGVTRVWQGNDRQTKVQLIHLDHITVTKFSNDIVNFSDDNSYATSIKKKTR